MNAEQIIAEVMQEWECYDADAVVEVCQRLRLAGIDLDHTYDRVTPEHEAGRLASAPAVRVDGVWVPVFVRRPLEGS